MKTVAKLSMSLVLGSVLFSACSGETKLTNAELRKLNADRNSNANVAAAAPANNTSANVSATNNNQQVAVPLPAPIYSFQNPPPLGQVINTGYYQHDVVLQYANRSCPAVSSISPSGAQRNWLDIVHREPTGSEIESLKQALCDTDPKRAANLFCRTVTGVSGETVFGQYQYFNFRANPQFSGGRSLMQCRSATSNPQGAFFTVMGNFGYLDDGNLCGGSDPNMPRLPTLFKDFEVERNNTANFIAGLRISRTFNTAPPSDIEICNGYDETVPVSAAALQANVYRDGAGNVIRDVIEAPNSGYRVDRNNDFQATVLYAHTDEATLTLKYAYSDSVMDGYTVYFENVCIDPMLQAAFDSCTPVVNRNTGERRRNCMIQVKGNERLATAIGNHVKVAIRRDGRLIDTRCRNLWQ